MKILLVKDDGETAAYIIRGLGEQGHRVTHRASGRDGLSLAAQNAYDVIVAAVCCP